jgi:glutamate-ammonia-ligase adenylyltransferase
MTTWSDILRRVNEYSCSPEEKDQLEHSLHSLRERCNPADPQSGVLLDLILAMLATPNPPGAVSLLGRYLDELENVAEFCARLAGAPRAGDVLCAVLGYSEFLANVLIREPHLLWWVVAPEQLEKALSLEEFRSSASEAIAHTATSDECQEALCRWKYHQLLRIGVRDVLCLASIEEVTRELSDVAHVCIEVAATQAWDELVVRYGKPMTEGYGQVSREAGMCVIGMGKLGGRELNFCSDIDLVFIYDDEGETTGEGSQARPSSRISNHEFFNKMGERLVRFLSARGPQGQLFRVDMRLRPEGKSGPLARSLESFMSYLEQQARDWECVAYLKARVLTGPAVLRARLYQLFHQFVFEKADPMRVTNEIEKLKLMIDREVLLSDIYHHEVKRGYGGIREIEFIIAAMQIIYGQSHEALRVRNIFLAIDRLADVNILPREEAEFYQRAYAFLRRVEHRLQMASEHQTHTLPLDLRQREILARRCHFSSLDEFEQAYREITSGVHERFAAFFQRDIEAEARELQEVLVLLEDDASAEEAIPILERYGIGSEHSFRLLRDLAFGTREVFITAQGQQYFEQMLPSLLRLIGQAPLPHRVLPNLHSFMLAVGGITYYYELIAQHPEILRLLVMLFGTSDDFAQVLCSHPEFFDSILGTRLLHDQLTWESVAERVAATVGTRGSVERRAVALRRAVKFEQLIVALRYLTGLAPLETTVEDLATVADVAVRCAYGFAWQRYAEKQGATEPPPLEALLSCDELAIKWPITILALGKYGGRELNFFGDLDVAYIWDDTPRSKTPTGITNHENALAFIDQFVYIVTENLQEGRLYALDARLRPHGRNSPLVTPLSHYCTYMREEADVWELMAFTRARCVVGDPSLLVRLHDAAKERRATFSLDEIRRRCVDMRTRLEQAVTEVDRTHHEFKRSAGGLADIEFLMQYWILKGALKGSESSGGPYFRVFVDPDVEPPCGMEHWRALGEAYAFLRKVETAVRLVAREKAARLPAEPASARGVARLLNKENQEILEQELENVLHQTRQIFQCLMRGA